MDVGAGRARRRGSPLVAPRPDAVAMSLGEWIVRRSPPPAPLARRIASVRGRSSCQKQRGSPVVRDASPPATCHLGRSQRAGTAVPVPVFVERRRLRCQLEPRPATREVLRRCGGLPGPNLTRSRRCIACWSADRCVTCMRHRPERASGQQHPMRGEVAIAGRTSEVSSDEADCRSSAMPLAGLPPPAFETTSGSGSVGPWIDWIRRDTPEVSLTASPRSADPRPATREMRSTLKRVVRHAPGAPCFVRGTAPRIEGGQVPSAERRRGHRPRRPSRSSWEPVSSGCSVAAPRATGQRRRPSASSTTLPRLSRAPAARRRRSTPARHR